MKKLYIFLISLAALACSCWAALYYFNHSSFVTDKFSQIIQEKTGAPVHFARMPQISLFPCAIHARRLSWKGRVKNCDLEFSARNIFVSTSLLALITGNTGSLNIVLQQPQIVCRKVAEGATGEKAPSGDFSLPELKSLVIENGHFVYENESESLEIANISFSVHNGREGEQLKPSVSCTSLYKNRELSLPAFQFISSGPVRFAREKIECREFEFSVAPVELGKNSPFWPAQGNLTAVFNFDDWNMAIAPFMLKLPAGSLSANGQLHLKPFSWQGSLEGQADSSFLFPDGNPFPLSFSATKISYAAQVLEIPDISLKIDAGAGSGHLKAVFDHRLAPVSITAKLALTDASLDKILSAKSGSKGKIPALSVLDALPDLDIELAGNNVSYKKVSVQTFLAHLVKNRKRLTLYIPAVAWAGGKIYGHAQSIEDNIDLEMQCAGLNLGTAFDQLDIPDWVGGETSARASLSAPMEDISLLSGSGFIHSERLGVKILDQLLAYLPFKTKFEPGVDLHADFKISQGLLDLNPIAVTGKGLSISGQTEVTLPDLALDGSLEAKIMDINIPLKVGGSLKDISLRPQGSILDILRKEFF